MSALEQNASADAPEGGEVIEKPKLSKDSWLQGDGDLKTVELDVPAPVNDTVAIRSLSAFHLSQIQDQASKLKGDEMVLDSGLLRREKFRRGVVEPEFTAEEVTKIARKYGPAFDLVVSAIDEISETDEEALAEAKRRFRPRR